MSVRVRPFAERDYSAFTRIWRICQREDVQPEDIRARDVAWDHARYEKVRVVAVDEEDVPVGYGEIYHEPTRFEPHRYFVRLGVEPHRRRAGIGAVIWDRLASELRGRRARIACLWADDNTACASFVARREFSEVIRSYGMVIPTSTAPVATPADEDALERAGLRISTLAALMRERPDAVERAHELYFASRIDQPSLGPVTPSPLEQWQRDHLDRPNAPLDSYFIALDGTRYVGQCNARRSRNEDVLDIEVTGVLPSHRRRGIGRALKLRLHAHARANGYREVHTSVARENVPMVRLNERLGYVIVESWAGYELAIPSSP